MTTRKTFPVGDALDRDPNSPTFGEPARITEPNIRVPHRKTPIYPLARKAVASARAMGKEPPEWALKWLDREEAAGEVPAGVVPAPPGVRGSIVPDIVPSRLIPDTGNQWKGLIEQAEVIDPPFNPWLLVNTALESDSLGPAIEAMATNIGGFGFELEPLFETEDDKTGETKDPPAEALEERGRLRLFLVSASVELSMQGLIYQVDQDVEETGNGYIEVLRNRLGEVASLEHAPSWTMRLGRLSLPILVDQPVLHPETGEIVLVPGYRRFRTFVQIREQRVTFFKQFGDPRSINRKTGQYLPPGESWGNDEQGNSLDGTEIRHFRIYASWTPYGIPRWLGAMPQIRAGRYTGELLADWFDNAPIGAKVAMVAGGVWSKESMNKAMGQIDDLARGIDNAWTIIALEAEASFTGDPIDAGKEQRPQIALQDLAVNLPPELYQGGDSLWQVTRSHVRGMFRLPPIYFGSSDDYTRATSATARATTEEQVFVPLRDLRWGTFLNGELLPAMEVNHWKIKLKGANTGDDTELPVSELVQGGGASPNALIGLFNELTGSDRDKIPEPWADRPLPMVIELLKLKLNPNKPIEELIADIEAKEEQARQEATEQLQALNGGKGPGKPGQDQQDGAQPPEDTEKEQAQKAAAAEVLDTLRRAGELRRLMELKIAREAETDDWHA